MIPGSCPAGRCQHKEEAAVPPPRGDTSGVCGAICPCPRRWLISLPALPRPSAAAASPATAGRLFHSNSLRWLPREGCFYPGTGLWQDIPPAFLPGCFFHLPSSGGACRAQGRESSREPRVDRDASLCLPRPASTSASTAARPASSSPLHCPSPAIPPSLSLLEHWERGFSFLNLECDGH